MDEILNWLPAELATLPRYVVALAIGLLIGLERERNPAAKAGLRTFALTALFGVLTTHLATELGGGVNNLRTATQARRRWRR